MDSCDRILCLAQCYLEMRRGISLRRKWRTAVSVFQVGKPADCPLMGRKPWGTVSTIPVWGFSRIPLDGALKVAPTMSTLPGNCGLQVMSMKFSATASGVTKDPPSILEDCLKNYALEDKEFSFLAELLP